MALHGDILHAEADVLKVINGDTVESGEVKVRLLDIDAAEIHHAQCDAEHRLGEVTKHRLEELIRSGPIEFRPDLADPNAKKDRYGRTLSHLLVNGEDVACILMKEGYVRPWRGHREDWCNESSLALPAAPQEADCATAATY